MGGSRQEVGRLELLDHRQRLALGPGLGFVIAVEGEKHDETEQEGESGGEHSEHARGARSPSLKKLPSGARRRTSSIAATATATCCHDDDNSPGEVHCRSGCVRSVRSASVGSGICIRALPDNTTGSAGPVSGREGRRGVPALCRIRRRAAAPSTTARSAGRSCSGWGSIPATHSATSYCLRPSSSELRRARP